MKNLHIDELKVISKYLKDKFKPQTLVDIGAMNGDCTDLFRDRNWNCFTVECNSNLLPYLYEKYSNYDNVKVVAKAIANQNKKYKLYKSEESLGITSLLNFHTTHEFSEEVDAITFSDLVNEYSINNIDFLKIDYQKLRNEIINSEDEIRNYYDANKVSFYSNEARSFKYFIISSDDYASSVQIPEDYVENEYANYLALNNQNKQIRFSHIMLEKSKYDSPEIALEKVSTVLDQLKSGEDFSILASKYSDDMVTKDIGGDLEYFDADIFPEQFAEALEGLDVNQVSEIVELEDTFHILKITEVNESEIVSLDEMSKIIIDDLIKSESLALMNDDYDAIDEMIFSNATIESIGESISREILDESDKQLGGFDFVVSNSIIQDFIFSPDTEIGKPTILNLDDSIIVLSLKEIKEPKLQNFDEVYEDVNDYLSDNKTIEKRNLLTLELEAAKKENTLESFFNAYDFIAKDSYVELKRNSSLLPPEVVAEVFKLSPGNSITLNARDGDVYMIDVLKINSPTSEFIDSIYDQYSSFSEQRISSNIAEIINEDIFESAKVNLNNLVF